MFGNSVKVSSRSSGAADGSAIGSVQAKWAEPEKHLFGYVSLPIAGKLTAEGTVGFLLRSAVGRRSVCQDHEGFMNVCVYTQHAETPQQDKSYLGTCDSALLRKFHILPITGPAFPLWAWMGFKSLNCCCYN